MAVDEGRLLVEELMRFKPAGLSANAWAVKAGISRNFWNDLRRHGNPSRRTLEKLLSAADSSLAEFEALRAGAPSPAQQTTSDRLGEAARRRWSQSPPPKLPLVASAFGGEWSKAGSGIELTQVQFNEQLESIARPASLASDPEAYALTIIGDSMWPRFRPGRQIAISPRSPVAIGDDVLVHLGGIAEDGRTLVLIKELFRRTAAALTLRQFNPDRSFDVQAAEIAAVHKVVGELF